MSASAATRLARDLRAAPAKTAVLAVLTIAGICVWVARWNSNAAPPIVAAPATGQLNAAGPRIATSNAGVSTATWQELEKLRQRDPLLQVGEPTHHTRNPFVTDHTHLPIFAEVTAEPEPPVAPSRPTPPSSTPDAEAVGLVLTSTALGKKNAAIINRRFYLEGGTITVGESRWRLASVQPRYVILEQGSQQVRLRLHDRTRTAPVPETSGDD